MLEQAAQGTLAPRRETAKNDTLLRVFSKDKTKEFTVNQKVESSLEIQARAIAEARLKYEPYLEHYRNYQKYLNIILFEIAEYLADENIKSVDRNFLHKAVFSIALNSLEADKPKHISDDEYYSESLSNFSKMRNESAIISEPEPVDKKRSAPRKELNADLVNSVSNVLAALEAGGADASEVRAAFAQAGRPIEGPTSDEPPSPPPMELPIIAPKLWADNTEGLTATAFVAKYYAPWIEAGVLTLKSISDCGDPALSKAYSNRAHRHPDEALPLAKASDPRFIADPVEAIERYRANTRAAGAKHRAKRGVLTHG